MLCACLVVVLLRVAQLGVDLAGHDVLVGLLEVGEGLEADGAELIDPALDLVLGVRLLLEDLADGLVEEGLDLLGDEGELREEGERGGGGWTGRRGGGGGRGQRDIRDRGG